MSGNIGLLWFGCAMLVLALGLWLWARGGAARAAAALPQGHVIYADDGAWQRPETTLISHELMLAGRPDYLVRRRDGSIIPVEIKARPSPHTPFLSHTMQLIAYCALVQAAYGVRPPYGILQYSDRAFSIPFSLEREAELLDTLAWMHQDAGARSVERSHLHAARCRACPVRHACDDRLA